MRKHGADTFNPFPGNGCATVVALAVILFFKDQYVGSMTTSTGASTSDTGGEELGEGG